MTGRVTGGKRDGFNQSLKRNVFFEAIEELSEHDLERYVCFARRRRDADLRFIFSDPDKIIEAGTCVDLDGKRLPQITYAQWAVEIGFRWCGKELPEDWIEKLTKRKREKKI